MRRASLRDIIANAINVQFEKKFAIKLNASRFTRKRVRLILRSLVKRFRFTLRFSQSRNELKRLQTKLRRLKKELQRLQKVQRTFIINVKIRSRKYEFRKKKNEMIREKK